MNISVFRRTLAALAVSVLVPATVGLTATAASASPAAPRPVTCHKVVGSPTALTAALTHCSSSSTGGSGAISNFLPTGGHVLWANGTTTDYTTAFTNPGGTGCSATTTEFDLTGSVTASTNPATPVGSAVSMEVCVSHKRITKKPGTSVTF